MHAWYESNDSCAVDLEVLHYVISPRGNFCRSARFHTVSAQSNCMCVCVCVWWYVWLWSNIHHARCSYIVKGKYCITQKLVAKASTHKLRPVEWNNNRNKSSTFYVSTLQSSGPKCTICSMHLVRRYLIPTHHSISWIPSNCSILVPCFEKKKKKTRHTNTTMPNFNLNAKQFKLFSSC